MSASIGRRPIILAAAALVVAGLGALAWWGAGAGNAGAPLYRYVVGTAAPSADTLALAELVPGATVELRDLSVADPSGKVAAAARAEVLLRPEAPPVILGWQNLVPEPVLRGDIRPAEERALIEALRKHLPDGATVLAMPETSRRLAAFVEARFPLAGSAEPLRLPAPWARAGAQVAAIEAQAWSAGATGDGDEALAALADALLAEDINGAARLRVLAGAGEGFVILHLRDLFALGLLRPEAFPVVQRDFAFSPSSHDMAREVKTFAATEKLAAYAIERAGDERLRAWFLPEARQKSMLIGQLLPFSTARLAMTPGANIAFQTGSYWVYRLTPVKTGS